MVVTAGDMRHRITIEEPVFVRNDYGEEEITWSQVATVWASMRDQRTGSREQMDEGTEIAERRTVFGIRYHPDVDESNRVIFDGDEYEIQAIFRDDTARNDMEIQCLKKDVEVVR